MLKTKFLMAAPAFFLIAAMVLLPACKKDCDCPGTPATTVYFPLQVGNWWVFETFSGDTAGNFNSTGNMDSLAITGEQTINGNNYFVIGGTSIMGSLLLRDSSNYLVDPDGRIYLSTGNFTDVLRTETNNNYTLQYRMYKDISVTTPAGGYTTYQLKGNLTQSSNYPVNEKYFVADYYAKTIGPVMMHRFYYNNPNTVLEYRLKRYHVQ